MQARERSYTDEASAPVATGGELPFLVLGGAHPPVPGTAFGAPIGASCAGVVLVGAVDPVELAVALDGLPDPAVPVIDFGGNRHIRSDIAGAAFDEGMASELRARLAPIYRRLESMPFRSAPDDRAELTILRLAWSRDCAIEAGYDPDVTAAVGYRLLGRGPSHRELLENLSSLGLLRRRHFTRTHLCAHCDSARLNALETCSSCGGADLGEEPIVHHYRCGWQAPESAYLRDHALICPKCRRELRHHGVDYDKPGVALVCHACGKASSDAALKFACLDCGRETTTADARSVDWYHYDLTEDGVRALETGRVPRFDIREQLEGHPRAFGDREFALLVREGLRVARRYQRPFALGRIALLNADAMRRDHGVTRADEAFRRAADSIAEALRDSDFIRLEDSRSVLIGFPETTETAVLSTLCRIGEQAKAAVDLPIEFSVSAAEGDRISGFIGEAPIP